MKSSGIQVDLARGIRANTCHVTVIRANTCHVKVIRANTCPVKVIRANTGHVKVIHQHYNPHMQSVAWRWHDKLAPDQGTCIIGDLTSRQHVTS